MNSSKTLHPFRSWPWPHLLICLISLLFLLAGIWNVSARMSVFAIDGPFQVWNPLQRMLAGQLPGRDFDVFHGVGYLWLHFIPFVALGGSFLASEFVRNLLPPLSVVFALYPYLRTTGLSAATSWTISFFTSTTLFLGLRTTLAYMIVSGASSIPLRVSIALLALFAVFHVIDHRLSSQPLAAGAMVGGLVGTVGFFSTDQTIFLLVTVFLISGLAVATIDNVTCKRRLACGLLYFVSIVPFSIGVCILLHSIACGGNWHRPLEMAYKIIPSEQVWYFGSPPFTYAKSLSDFFSCFYIIHPLPLLAAAALLIGLWEPISRFRIFAWVLLGLGFFVSLPFIPIAWSSGKTWTLQCVGTLFFSAGTLLLGRRSSFKFRGWIWPALIVYGTLSMAPNLVYETKAYFAGPWRAAMTILLCGLIGVITNLRGIREWTFHQWNVTIRSRPWTAVMMAAFFLAGLYWTWPDRSLPLESVLAKIPTVEWQPGSAVSIPVREISGITVDPTYGKTYASALTLGSATGKNTQTIFSTYTGVIDSSLNSRNPVSDYMVHALGPRWQAYVEAFKREKPPLVQIQRRGTPGTPAYTQHTNWAFFRELLENYSPVLSSGWSAFWKRDPGASLQVETMPEREYPVIVLNAPPPEATNSKPPSVPGRLLKAALPAPHNSDRPAFLECTLSYTTRPVSPFASFFSKFTRTVVCYDGLFGREVFGLPPALLRSQIVTFPVFVDPKAPAEIFLWNENPFGHFETIVSSRSFRRITISQVALDALASTQRVNEN